MGGGVLCGAVAGTAAARRQGNEGQRGTSGPRALGVQRSGVRGQRSGDEGPCGPDAGTITGRRQRSGCRGQENDEGLEVGRAG